MALESNRAVVAAKNAEIRRAKNVLLTEAISSLEKKVKKGKGVNKAIIEDRQNKVGAHDAWLFFRKVPLGMDSCASAFD